MTPDTDDIEIFFDKGDGGCFLESLARTKIYLSKIYRCDCTIMTKIDSVLELELDLAIMGAEKAKSEIVKASAKDKDNLRPIK